MRQVCLLAELAPECFAYAVFAEDGRDPRLV
jgi:hypothetical protein